MLKSMICCVVMTVGVLLMVSCSKEESSSSSSNRAGTSSAKIKIGFLAKQPEEPWFQHEWMFADRAAADLGFEVVKLGVPDGEKTLAAIDNLAAQGVQGFIICAPDVRLGPAIVAKSKAAGLKVMSVDDRFVGADGKPMEAVHHMGISARKIGNAVGQALIDEMSKRGWKPEETVAMGVTLMELDTARERTDGAIETMVAAGFDKARIFTAPLRGLAEVSNAINAADIVLTQQSNHKNWLVFGMNDESVLGGIRALEGRGFKAANVIGVGIGGSTGMLEWQRAEATGFHAAVLISPKRHGYETTASMFKWIKDGVEPPKAVFTEGILITKENYRQVMAEQGLLPKEGSQ